MPSTDRQCWGRTRKLSRCRNTTRGILCYQHRFQWLGLLLPLIAVVGTAASLYQLLPRGDEPKLSPSDIRFRLTATSPLISQEHLTRVPRAIAWNARVDHMRLEFDLILLDGVSSWGGGRGPVWPALVYNSENLRFLGLNQELTNKVLAGRRVKLTAPYSLTRELPENTLYGMDLFVRDKWYPFGFVESRVPSFEVEIRGE